MTTEPEIQHPTAENAKPPDETFRLLFLDSAENVEMLTEACKEDGYAVVGATTIDQAWSFLNGKDHVDVLVCAAHLEEESMFRLLHEVRMNAQHGKLTFLILSLEPGMIGASLDISTARVGISLGADAYLVMPVFDPTQLIAQIKLLQPRVPMLQQSTTPEEKQRSQ